MITEATTLFATLLLKFALGYFAILATPGPNMFTIGTMAALRGCRGRHRRGAKEHPFPGRCRRNAATHHPGGPRRPGR
jgi:hypothetical protein